MERARAEYVVRVAGTLRLRKDPNPQLPTGAVELVAEEVRSSRARVSHEVCEWLGLTWTVC